MNKHAESINKATTIHAEMVARLAIARLAMAANEARRHGLALAAETGDADAKREVGALAKASASLKDNIEHGLAHAVEQAALRVTAARQEADLEVKRQNAQKARELWAGLATLGAEMDALMSRAQVINKAVKAGIAKIEATGCPVPRP